MRKLLLLVSLFVLLMVPKVYAEESYSESVKKYVDNTSKSLYVVQIEDDQTKYQFWSFKSLKEDNTVYTEYLIENDEIKDMTEFLPEDYDLIKILNDYKEKQESIGFNMQNGKVKEVTVNFDPNSSNIQEMHSKIKEAFEKSNIILSDFKQPKYVTARYVTYGNIHALVAEYKDKSSKVLYKFSIIIRKGLEG